MAATPSSAAFSAAAVFSPIAPQQPSHYLFASGRLRCATCGGTPVVGEIELVTIRDEPKADFPRGRAGRPRLGTASLT
jgi:hypothetical protein